MGNMHQQVHGMGLDLKGRRLFPGVDGLTFTSRLIDALERNRPLLQDLRHAREFDTAFRSDGAEAFRGEQRRGVIDVGDVPNAGWTFLVNAADPRRAELVAALGPLAKRRKMDDPAQPLLYVTCDPDDWGSWLENSYKALTLEGKRVPRYVLIVGGPDQVPFGLQSLLDTVANVGRIDLPTIDQLAVYVAKLLRLESGAGPVVSREAIVFAPDGGPNDPTHFSCQYMAKPIADLLTSNLKLSTTRIMGDEATKAALTSALIGKTPALVYTASHGLGAVNEPFEVQTRYNGSICCQTQGSLTLDGLFGADDVPPDDQAFLEGSVFFQFACYGYGTPAVSEYAHWLDQPGKESRNADHDFVAALPKRLLAHPKGPIAFIGHLDTAFLHGFADATAPETSKSWHNRIEPFTSAVQMLLGVQATGLAMQSMNDRYNSLNSRISDVYDRIQRGKMEWTEASQANFLDTWITRGDAKNYMVFGDPGVSLRLPEP